MTDADNSNALRKDSFSTVARLLWELFHKVALSQRKGLVTATLFIIISTFASLTGPFIIKEIIDQTLPGRDLKQLLLYGLLLLLSNAIGFVFWSVHSHFAVKASERMFLQFRQQLMVGIMSKRLEFFSKYFSGDILTRVSIDLEYLSNFFHQTVLHCLAFFVFSLILVTGLIIWNWRLGLIFLVTLPFLHIYSRITHGPLAANFKLSREQMALQNQTLLDILGGIREIRFYQQIEGAARRFFNDSKRYSDQNIKSLTLNDWFSGGLDFLSVTVRILPFIVGGILICRGSKDITIGTLVAYFVIFFRLATQIFFVFQAVITSAQALPALQRMKEILDFPEEESRGDFTLRHVPDTTDIEFRDVFFAYPQGKEVFARLNLHIEPGDKLAIMGPSGSGKSTIALLITRFLRPSAGKIVFGAKDVESYPLPFYLTFFAYVGQETHLFRETLRENISMGWYGVPLDKIKEVATLVRMDKVIEDLPSGYETVFAEGGLNLSGGQKQRIALARALVRDPHILVLDEFTSGLDSEVEREILDDLFRIFEKQTIICITHKESVAARFDRIFVIPRSDISS